MNAMRAVAVLCLAFSMVICAQPARAQIVLNELMPDPASDWSPILPITVRSTSL